MHRLIRLFNAPPLFAVLALWTALFLAPRAHAQAVTSDGWDQATAGREFYVEVPMIDNSELSPYGVGGVITAKGVASAVRYASNHPDIQHVVFMMDTGGGALHHAEAMEDVIERHHGKLEFHIVVQNAISAGIWTAFSCDSIFMCSAGTIGGATAYYQTSDRSVAIAEDIDNIAARLEITAVRNGYPGQIIRPLMIMNSELHTWTGEDGERVLSNDKPDEDANVENYKQLDHANTVLTLTANDAVDIGIAKHIEGFDSAMVGEKIGVPGWTRANRYGQVADEIAYVYNITRRLEDDWVDRQLGLPSYPVLRANRDHPQIKNMLETRRDFADVVAALRLINEALIDLLKVHPERHIYLETGDGVTLVEDFEQWEEDASSARSLSGKLRGAYERLADAFEQVKVDKDNLEDIAKPILTISSRINGITNYGSVAYWKRQDQRKN